jgi:hypothetical protein
MNISPASATIKHCEKRKCGIQEINDVCYRVASAFSGSDVWNVPPKYSAECDNIVEIARKQIYGVKYCDHKTPYKPLVLNPPSEFVRLYKMNNNVEKSLIECKRLCAMGRNPNECVVDCDIMSGAITNDTKDTKDTKEGRENYYTSNDDHPSVKRLIKMLKVFQIITYFFIFAFYTYMMYNLYKSDDSIHTKKVYSGIYTGVSLVLCVINYFAIYIHFMTRVVVIV